MINQLFSLRRRVLDDVYNEDDMFWWMEMDLLVIKYNIDLVDEFEQG